MSIQTILALLLAATACGCATVRGGPNEADPGRLPSAARAVQIAGLRPCSDATDRTLHLDPRQPATILVHGHNASVASQRALARALAQQGQQAVCFEYRWRDSLMHASGQLSRAIDALAGQLDAPAITVIGHSVGGLVARKALVADRPDPLRRTDATLQLVTIATPFGGIASASLCANPLALALGFGLTQLGCWLISGDHWQEITANADFIRHPGTLLPQVRRHLLVVTDERSPCPATPAPSTCSWGDYVFSQTEQQQATVLRAPGTSVAPLVAGHRESVGITGTPPRKLMALLQREGLLPTAAAAFASP